MICLTLKQFKQFLKTLIRTKYLKTKEDMKKFIIDIWLDFKTYRNDELLCGV
jgi:hypothetical protein